MELEADVPLSFRTMKAGAPVMLAVLEILTSVSPSTENMNPVDVDRIENVWAVLEDAAAIVDVAVVMDVSAFVPVTKNSYRCEALPSAPPQVHVAVPSETVPPVVVGHVG